jgi:hypothetical protein
MLTALVAPLAIALGLTVWGAHAVRAGTLRGGAARWRFAALPAALAIAALGLWLLGRRPDAAIAAGFTLPLPTQWLHRTALAMLLAGVLGDAALLLRPPQTRAEAALAGVLGWSAAAGAALAAELLRDGSADSAWLFLLLAALCRLGISLGAGEIASPTPARWAPCAAAALALYPLALPAPVSRAILHSGDALTGSAAVALFAAARFLPERLRRGALVGAICLAALVLWRAQVLNDLVTAGTPTQFVIE